MKIRSSIRRATINLLRLSAAKAAGRFIAHCFQCSREMPPGQEGGVLQENGPVWRRHWIAALCPTCETWWIVSFASPTPAGKKGGALPHIGAIRRATPVEAAMAHLRLHLPTKPKPKSRRSP